MSNRELLAERKRMRSGKYVNVKYGKKTWTQHLELEIKKRKKAGKMKKSAGRRKQRASNSFFF